MTTYLALGCYNHRREVENAMRRLRAVGVFAVIWGIAWAPAGLVFGLRHLLLGHIPFSRFFVEFVAALIAMSGVLGAIAGAAFATALLFLARRRPMDRLPTFWVAFVVAAVGFGLGAAIEPGYVSAVIFALLGAATAAGSLALAQRSDVAAPATQRTLKLTNDLRIANASHSLLFDSFAAWLGRYAATRTVVRPLSFPL